MAFIDMCLICGENTTAPCWHKSRYRLTSQEKSS